MKFKIKYYCGEVKWALQYRWYDEGGGGWRTIVSCRWKFFMRAYARVWIFFRNREVARMGQTETFTL